MENGEGAHEPFATGPRLLPPQPAREAAEPFGHSKICSIWTSTGSTCSELGLAVSGRAASPAAGDRQQPSLPRQPQPCCVASPASGGRLHSRTNEGTRLALDAPHQHQHGVWEVVKVDPRVQKGVPLDAPKQVHALQLLKAQIT